MNFRSDNWHFLRSSLVCLVATKVHRIDEILPSSGFLSIMRCFQRKGFAICVRLSQRTLRCDSCNFIKMKRGEIYEKVSSIHLHHEPSPWFPTTVKMLQAVLQQRLIAMRHVPQTVAPAPEEYFGLWNECSSLTALKKLFERRPIGMGLVMLRPKYLRERQNRDERQFHLSFITK